MGNFYIVDFASFLLLGPEDTELLSLQYSEITNTSDTRSVSDSVVFS